MRRAIATFLLGAFLGLFALAAPARSLAADFALRAYYFLPKGDPTSVIAEKFWRAIEEAGRGKIEIKRYWMGEVVGTREALDALERGTIDLLGSGGNYYAGRVAIGDIGMMPHTFKSHEEMVKLFFETEVGKLMDQVYQRRVNAKLLAPDLQSPQQILMGKKAKKVRTIADLKGLKLRFSGGEDLEVLKAMGATPVGMVPGEAEIAMKVGTLDGAIWPVYTLVPESLNWKEVTSQVVLPDLTPGHTHWFWMNLDTWKKLSPELQKAVEKAAYEHSLRSIEDVKALAARGYELAKKEGIEVYTLPSTEVAKLKPAFLKGWEGYIATSAKQGAEAEAKKIRDILLERWK